MVPVSHLKDNFVANGTSDRQPCTTSLEKSPLFPPTIAHMNNKTQIMIINPPELAGSRCVGCSLEQGGGEGDGYVNVWMRNRRELRDICKQQSPEGDWATCKSHLGIAAHATSVQPSPPHSTPATHHHHPAQQTKCGWALLWWIRVFPKQYLQTQHPRQTHTHTHKICFRCLYIHQQWEGGLGDEIAL